MQYFTIIIIILQCCQNLGFWTKSQDFGSVKLLINLRCACVQRGLLYLPSVYVRLFALICHLTHWNHKREIPTASSQYRNHFKFDQFF